MNLIDIEGNGTVIPHHTVEKIAGKIFGGIIMSWEDILKARQIRVAIDYGEDSIDFNIKANPTHPHDEEGLIIYLIDSVSEIVGRENGVLYPSGIPITVTFGDKKLTYPTIVEDKKNLEYLAQDIKFEIEMKTEMYNEPDYLANLSREYP